MITSWENIVRKKCEVRSDLGSLIYLFILREQLFIASQNYFKQSYNLKLNTIMSERMLQNAINSSLYIILGLVSSG